MLPVRRRLSCGAMLMVLATSAASGVLKAQDVGAGQHLAEKNCARCHAIGRTGSSTHKEAPPFTEIVKLYPPAVLAEALAEGLSTGHPDMPEFVFSAEEGDSLIAYLESLQ